MSSPIISVERLGKRYTIRHQGAARGSYHRFSEELVELAKRPFRAAKRLRHRGRRQEPASEDFWALRDVSFDVHEGEVLGIIGRNGAGKSTLLKILSRITEPTEGRVRIRGRVASLLEVGTGFHPELTGRENIFLNGAILGMSRAEIRRKFDEIVDFAGVEKFLDTPVKRYSSGMYVRLAFAVAAHLEPEILVVDEVLAVGDAEFQRKCLGKMGSIAHAEGRTVLFVSHNLQAVQSLCDTALLLDKGKTVLRGAPREVIERHLASGSRAENRSKWTEGDAPGNAMVRLLEISVPRAEYSSELPSSDDIEVELRFLAHSPHRALCVGFDVHDIHGTAVLRTYQTDLPETSWPAIVEGMNHWRCTIPAGLMNAGTYTLSPRIGIHNVEWIVNSDPVIRFDVRLEHGKSPLWSSLSAATRPGVIAPVLDWKRVSE